MEKCNNRGERVKGGEEDGGGEKLINSEVILSFQCRDRGGGAGKRWRGREGDGRVTVLPLPV